MNKAEQNIIAETSWVRVADRLPPDGVVVDTLSENGLEQRLKRNGRLWFVQDGSMYVYYTPNFWREAQL